LIDIKFILNLAYKTNQTKMPKQMETRTYKMADGDLKQTADSLQQAITRDAADFAKRNIGAPQQAAYQALIDSFDATTTDEELKGMLKYAVEQKDNVANDIRVAIRPIRNMAEIAYNSKGKFSAFGFGDMGNMSDGDLYRLARRVVRVCGKLITDMQLQGLTAAQVTALDALATDFDKKIDAVEDAVETRDLETQDRIIKGNALWAETVRLASIGKSLYEDTNEAKYNDYVLISNKGSDSGNTPPTPPVG
jgi:hypothetical protein